MKTQLAMSLALLFGLTTNVPVHAIELSELKVVYVGTERNKDFADFLKDKVARFESIKRKDFKVQDVTPFDVVLLDWPQGQETREMRKLTSPLGQREEWEKPTVLLGSAGLNLAVAWKLKGGSGCTCMDPLAYDLNYHQIFERPFVIDRGKMVSIKTPVDFQTEIKDDTIQVLPLVNDRDRRWKAGWCSYSNDFSRNPDVEFFCGGVNQKTPTAAGLWRQGNLLHFGFEQSPAEMNESGRNMLLNSIVYISHFTEDRPIAVTPSVFAGPVARFRSTPARWLRNPEFPLDFVKDLVTAEIWETLSDLEDREKMAQWADAHARFFHPDASQKLEIDQDLVEMDLPFDQPEFFDRVLTDLSSKDAATSSRARRLLERYVPCGPESGTVADWNTWWKENRSYLFASDAGDYRWYIDPLAKKRRIASATLRGIARADSPVTPAVTSRP